MILNIVTEFEILIMLRVVKLNLSWIAVMKTLGI
jgi:hypothetical protein